ncbi:MAG: LysR family transcriptional regulator [Clostridiales bacterium]|nr:LysR family transcriptional regulator [Clostridiales bacterium]
MIENYKTFLVLTKTMNFSKTADYMNVVQSTVSARINELEKQLDVKLFTRTNRSVELTSAGQSLISYAKKMIELEKETIRKVQLHNKFKDCLSIGIPNSVFRERMSPLIYEFYHKYPEFSLDLRFSKTSEQLKMLLENDLDIGFVSRVPSTRKLKVSPCFDYSWILVCRSDYDIPNKIKRSELLNHDIVYNNQNEEYNEWLSQVLPCDFIPRMNLNSTSQLIDYVKRGFGCAFLPSYAISEELINSTFKQIEITDIKANSFSIYLAINKGKEQSEVVQKFVTLIEHNPEISTLSSHQKNL